MPWPFMIEKGDVGSINLASGATRVNDLFVNQDMGIFARGRSTSRFSQGPHTIIVDTLRIIRSWELNGTLTGSPQAYTERSSLVRFMETGDTQTNPTRFTYLGSGYTVAETRLLLTQNPNPQDSFTFQINLVAGSPRR